MPSRHLVIRASTWQNSNKHTQFITVNQMIVSQYMCSEAKQLCFWEKVINRYQYITYSCQNPVFQYDGMSVTPKSHWPLCASWWNTHTLWQLVTTQGRIRDVIDVPPVHFLNYMYFTCTSWPDFARLIRT